MKFIRKNLHLIIIIFFITIPLFATLSCIKYSPEELKCKDCGERFIIGSFQDPFITKNFEEDVRRIQDFRANGFNTLSGWTFPSDYQEYDYVYHKLMAVMEVEKNKNCSPNTIRLFISNIEKMPHNVEDICDITKEIIRHYKSPDSITIQTILGMYGPNPYISGDKSLHPITKSMRDLIYGYFIADEPDPETFCSGKYDDIKEIGKYARVIATNDPDKIIFCNLLGNIGRPNIVNEAEYKIYLNKYLNEIGSNVVSFDLYPFKKNPYWKNNMVPTYYLIHKIYAQKTINSSFSYYSFVFSINSDNFGDYENVTLSKLRFMCHTPIVYGASGIFYFTYWGINEYSGLYTPNGVPTKIQPWAKNINNNILKFSDILVNTTWITTVHGSSKDPLSGEKNLNITGTIVNKISDNYSCVGEFNSTNDIKYLIILNKDWKSPSNKQRKITIKLKKEYETNLIKYDNTLYCDSITKITNTEFTCNIQSGGMAVVKLSPKK